MSILNLSSVEFGNPEALQEFFDLNALEHDAVNDAVLDLGQEIDAMPLWTETPDQNWQFIHESQHNQLSVLLNLGEPPDLSGVDFNNFAQYDDWITAHAQHHSQIRAALGFQ